MCERLRSQLAAERQLNKHLTNENIILTKANSDLTNANVKLTARVAELSKGKQHLIDTIDELTERVATLLKEKDALTKQVHSLTAENTKLKATNLELTHEVSTLRAAVAKLRIDKRTLTEKVNTLTAKVAADAALIKQYIGWMQSLEEQRDKAQAQVKALESTVVDLKARIADLLSQKTQLEQDVARLTTEKTALQKQVETLTTEKAALQSRVDILLNQVDHLNTLVTTLRQTITDDEKKIAEGYEEIKQLNVQIENLQIEHHRQQVLVQKLEARLAAADIKATYWDEAKTQLQMVLEQSGDVFRDYIPPEFDHHAFKVAFKNRPAYKGPYMFANYSRFKRTPMQLPKTAFKPCPNNMLSRLIPAAAVPAFLTIPRDLHRTDFLEPHNSTAGYIPFGLTRFATRMGEYGCMVTNSKDVSISQPLTHNLYYGYIDNIHDLASALICTAAVQFERNLTITFGNASNPATRFLKGDQFPEWCALPIERLPTHDERFMKQSACTQMDIPPPCFFMDLSTARTFFKLKPGQPMMPELVRFEDKTFFEHHNVQTSYKGLPLHIAREHKFEWGPAPRNNPYLASNPPKLPVAIERLSQLTLLSINHLDAVVASINDILSWEKS